MSNATIRSLYIKKLIAIAVKNIKAKTEVVIMRHSAKLLTFESLENKTIFAFAKKESLEI